MFVSSEYRVISATSLITHTSKPRLVAVWYGSTNISRVELSSPPPKRRNENDTNSTSSLLLKPAQTVQCAYLVAAIAILIKNNREQAVKRSDPDIERG